MNTHKYIKVPRCLTRTEDTTAENHFITPQHSHGTLPFSDPISRTTQAGLFLSYALRHAGWLGYKGVENIDKSSRGHDHPFPQAPPAPRPTNENPSSSHFSSAAA